MTNTNTGNATGNTTGNATKTTDLTDTDITAIVDRYIAVWTITDPTDRAEAVATVWSADGIEYVDSKQFVGQAALVERVAAAHEAFFANGTYTGSGGDDAAVHGDLVTFTIRMHHAQGEDADETAWSSRVFLLLDPDGRVREDYQLTVQPLVA